jgi:hypothetical protein
MFAVVSLDTLVNWPLRQNKQRTRTLHSCKLYGFYRRWSLTLTVNIAQKRQTIYCIVCYLKLEPCLSIVPYTNEAFVSMTR